MKHLKNILFLLLINTIMLVMISCSVLPEVIEPAKDIVTETSSKDSGSIAKAKDIIEENDGKETATSVSVNREISPYIETTTTITQVNEPVDKEVVEPVDTFEKEVEEIKVALYGEMTPLKELLKSYKRNGKEMGNLFVAVQAGDLNKVIKLTMSMQGSDEEIIAKLQEKDMNEKTMLMYAIERNDVLMARFLIAMGDDTELYNMNRDDGRLSKVATFFLATFENMLSLMNKEVRIDDTKPIITSLTMLVMLGHFNLFYQVLDFPNFNINYTSSTGNTYLDEMELMNISSSQKLEHQEIMKQLKLMGAKKAFDL